MEHSATILNNLWRAPPKAAELIRVGLLGALLATLPACGGSDPLIINNDLAEPVSDGVAPMLESVTIKMARDRDPKPKGKAKLDQEIQIDIVASEAIMKPSVSINGEREVIPAILLDLVESASAETIPRAPMVPGVYRLFVYVRDPEGKVAHANLPFKVKA